MTWRPVPGYEILYEVSDRGEVRSCLTGKIRKPSVTSQGYALLPLSKNGKKQAFRVHTLVAKAFLGIPPEGYEVCHINGVRDDNRLENLRYGTRSENMADAVAQGTHNNARKTECIHGHPFDEKNTYWQPGGGRSCRICASTARQKYREKRQS